MFGKHCQLCHVINSNIFNVYHSDADLFCSILLSFPSLCHLMTFPCDFLMWLSLWMLYPVIRPFCFHDLELTLSIS